MRRSAIPDDIQDDLLDACEFGEADVIVRLLENYDALLRSDNEFLRTAITLAAENDHRNIVEIFKERGLNPFEGVHQAQQPHIAPPLGRFATTTDTTVKDEEESVAIDAAGHAAPTPPKENTEELKKANLPPIMMRKNLQIEPSAINYF